MRNKPDSDTLSVVKNTTRESRPVYVGSGFHPRPDLSFSLPAALASSRRSVAYLSKRLARHSSLLCWKRKILRPGPVILATPESVILNATNPIFPAPGASCAAKTTALGKGVGLYVHVPFCIKKCRYCDFVSYPYNDAEANTYISAVERETELCGADLSSAERVLDSVFIGGGTPTCLPADKLFGLLDKIRQTFLLTPDCEITVEANPGTVNEKYLAILREWGVNRLSLGVQAFQDHLLLVLGRIHQAAEATEAVRAAQTAGFDNINVDLIYGVPTQTKEDLLESLDRVVQLEPAHVAAYGLQIEPGTPLEQAVANNQLKPCDEDLELEMLHTVMDYLPANGYNHYEISNYAQPGRESRHNLKYWLNRQYLGLGPAAHTYIRGERRSNAPGLREYASRLAGGKLPVASSEIITGGIEMSETMITGLRLSCGVDLDSFLARFGRRAEEVYKSEIAALSKAGLVEIERGHLRLTTKGLPVGNLVFQEFVGQID